MNTKNKIAILFVALLASGSVFSGTSGAVVPQKLSYQGNLRESGLLITGTRSMRFRLYASSTSATPLWTSPATAVFVSTGVFRATLEPSGIDWENVSPWLELEVEGTVLSPREELTTSPYAFNARLHSGKLYASSGTAPGGSPNAGDLWYDTANNLLKYYNATTWVTPPGGSGDGADCAVGQAPLGVDANGVVQGCFDVVADAGGVMTGQLDLTGPTGNVVSQASVTASAFFGDGSALTGVVATDIADGAVTTAKLGDGAVTSAKLLDASVGTSKLAADAVTNAKLLLDADSLFKVSGGVMVSDGVGIGIGTASPGEKLDLDGAMVIRGMTEPSVSAAGEAKLYVDASGKLKISENGVAFATVLGGAPAGAVTLQGSAPGISDTGHLNITGTGLFGTVGVGVNNPEGRLEVRGTPADGYTLRLSTSSTSYQVVVTTMGKVGIGTASPNQKLHVEGGDVLIGPASTVHDGTAGADLFVEGNLVVDGKIVHAGEVGAFDTLAIATETVTTGELFKVGAGTLTVLENGNVGIGTTSPGNKLNVNGGAAFLQGASGSFGIAIRRVEADGNPRIRFTDNTDDTADIEMDSSNGLRDILFKNSATGSENMRITESGDVGIGTTGPAARLHVSSANAVAADTLLAVSSDTAAGSEVLVVKGDGKVGIGTASPAYPLHVVSQSAGRTSILIDNRSAGPNTSGALRFAKDGSDTWSIFTDASQNNIRDLSIYDAVAGYRLYLSSFGAMGINNITYPLATLDLNATLSPAVIPTLNFRGITTPPAPVLSQAGQAALYYDIVSNKLKVSENGGPYNDIIGAAPGNALTRQAVSPGSVESGHVNLAGHGIIQEGLEVSSPTAAATDAVFKVSNDITPGNEVLVVMGDGKVGIGTTSPAAKIHMSSGTLLVDGNAAIAAQFTTARDVAFGSVSGLIVKSANTNNVPPPSWAYGIRVLAHTDDNVAAPGTAYGLYSEATAVGGASAVGGYFSATGGANNYGLIVADGNVGIGTTGPSGAKLVVQNNGDGVPGMQIITTGAKPAASSSYRGAIFVEQGGAGVTDKIYMCMKNSLDTYVWVLIARGD